MAVSTLCTRVSTRTYTEITGKQVFAYILYAMYFFFIASRNSIFFENNIKSFQEDALRKREYKDEDGNEISRKRSKKLKRIARRPNRATSVLKRSSDRCHACPNPLVC